MVFKEFKRPGDVQGGIVPDDGALAGRVIEIGGLVEHLGRFGEHKEAVSEAFGNPEHLKLAVLVAGLQVEACPSSEVWGIAPEIDGDIPYMSGDDANELTLWSFKL